MYLFVTLCNIPGRFIERRPTNLMLYLYFVDVAMERRVQRKVAMLQKLASDIIDGGTVY